MPATRRALVGIRIGPDFNRLLFIDIEMPGGTGFDLVRQLKKGNRPEIVFVTSRDEYALRAFNCAALGYVLKPVEASTLAEAIARGGLEAVQYNIALKQVEGIADMASSAGNQTIVVPADAADAFGKAFQMLKGRGA